jgi:cell division protein FtsQ
VFSKRGTAVLEAPEERYASEGGGPRRVSGAAHRRLRRDLSEDFADDPYEDERPGTTRKGVRLRVRGLPTTKLGRIFAGCLLLLCVGLGVATYAMAKRFLLHDDRFVIPSSSSIQFDGTTHVRRAELLGVFGEDVERNIFSISLDQRRAQLEKLPWIEHATVMRLLPNKMRVLIAERTPVAFVRQDRHIGLVDRNGVLLDMPADTKTTEHYSFPVVTGISAADPLSTRAARMKIFERFTLELDSSGEKISQELSEVDLSNPEDVKALIPDHSAEVLVHFGEENFLDRYRRFKEHLPEWRAIYPKLASVDMRYERQVVLQMQPGSSVPSTASSDGGSADGSASSTSPAAGGTHSNGVAAVGTSAVKKKIDQKAKPRVVAAKNRPAGTKAPDGTPRYHPPQVVQR